jgi:hypothetical protein
MKRASTITAIALSLAIGWPLGFSTAVAQPTWNAAELQQNRFSCIIGFELLALVEF